MMESKMIKVVEYSKFPYRRTAPAGDFSGEFFRDEILIPAMEQNSKVIVDLNGVLSLGSSFLEEVFGGIVRKGNYSFQVLTEKLEIKFNIQSYVDQAWKYAKEAEKLNKK